MLGKVLGTTLRPSYRQFTTSAACNRFTLSYIIPAWENRIETETFRSAKDFRDSFPGFRFTNPKTNVTYAPSSIPNHVDPTVVYIARHPFLPEKVKDYSHKQISGETFVDRACSSLEHYLNKSFIVSRRVSDDPTRQDDWRIFTGEKDVAEWTGVWESSDGRIFFLEAKHFVDLNNIELIEKKLLRSLDLLCIDQSKATVYVAGNHWLNDPLKTVARTMFGFGILASNGLDLDVHEPITPSEFE